MPVTQRPIKDLPGMILKGIGFTIAGLFIIAITMADMGILRPVIERTHQYIPFVKDPSCVDIFTWYEQVEKDQKMLDREMDLLFAKESPTDSDVDLVINALNEHLEFIVDSDPPEDVIRLRSMYVEVTNHLISSMEAFKERDQEATIYYLDEGDRVSALIDQETDRINTMCGWGDKEATGAGNDLHLTNMAAEHALPMRYEEYIQTATT